MIKDAVGRLAGAHGVLGLWRTGARDANSFSFRCSPRTPCPNIVKDSTREGRKTAKNRLFGIFAAVFLQSLLALAVFSNNVGRVLRRGSLERTGLDGPKIPEIRKDYASRRRPKAVFSFNFFSYLGPQGPRAVARTFLSLSISNFLFFFLSMFLEAGRLAKQSRNERKTKKLEIGKEMCA